MRHSGLRKVREGLCYKDERNTYQRFIVADKAPSNKNSRYDEYKT